MPATPWLTVHWLVTLRYDMTNSASIPTDCFVPLLAVDVRPADGKSDRRFRGPWGDGHVSPPGDTNPIGLPLQWSETNNIKWKTEIPRGWSTRWSWGPDLLTTATEDGHDYFAICVTRRTAGFNSTKGQFHTDNLNCSATALHELLRHAFTGDRAGRVYVHGSGAWRVRHQTGKVL
jgi:hypothetical protein